jgi:ribosome biogenesis GTPase
VAADNQQPHGLVIASYGRRGILTDSSGNKHRFVLKGRKLRAVCGDRVVWQVTPSSEECLVSAIVERDNVLERPDSRGKTEAMAANLSQLVVVLATLPEPDFFLADRYLCAAELMRAKALLVINKTDLDISFAAELAQYEQLGYQVIKTSATNGDGIDTLLQSLSADVSMLAGQSGVGKSSLINALIPDKDVTVGEISSATKEGRHTTTASFMHELPNGGKLIDSPGVREFAPVISNRDRIQAGYREIIALAHECRFSNCQHLREPDCAVKSAVDEQRIFARRYESYKRLHNTTAALR